MEILTLCPVGVKINIRYQRNRIEDEKIDEQKAS